MQLSLAFIGLCAALTLFPCGAVAQMAASCKDKSDVCAYQKPLADLLDSVAKANTKGQGDALDALVHPERVPDYFVLALAEGSVFANSVNAWEEARVDQQVGGSTTSSGTTDLVARPSTPELLGLAMQAGALTQNVSGTTATFTANLYGSYKAILGNPVVCLAC